MLTAFLVVFEALMLCCSVSRLKGFSLGSFVMRASLKLVEPALQPAQTSKKASIDAPGTRVSETHGIVEHRGCVSGTQRILLLNYLYYIHFGIPEHNQSTIILEFWSRAPGATK